MYGLYKRRQSERALEFSHLKVVHLFGRNDGWIPWLLTESYKEESEPLKWNLPIDELVNFFEPECSLLINLKPKASRLHFYEVVRAWGHSSEGWTPVMLGLCPLNIDLKSVPCDSDRFRCERANEPCFSTNYLNGTMKLGKLQGNWSPPGPSSTNGVLLWPETFEYFATEARKFIDKNRDSGSLAPQPP